MNLWPRDYTSVAFVSVVTKRPLFALTHLSPFILRDQSFTMSSLLRHYIPADATNSLIILIPTPARLALTLLIHG